MAANFAKLIVKMNDKTPVIKIVMIIIVKLDVVNIGRSWEIATAAPVLVF